MKKATPVKDYAVKAAAACNSYQVQSFTLDEFRSYLRSKNQFNSFINVIIKTLIDKALISEIPDVKGREKFFQFTCPEPINYAMLTLEIKKEQESKKNYNQQRKAKDPKSVDISKMQNQLVKLEKSSKKLAENVPLMKAIQLCEANGCPVMIPAHLLF